MRISMEQIGSSDFVFEIGLANRKFTIDVIAL